MVVLLDSFPSLYFIILTILPDLTIPTLTKQNIRDILGGDQSDLVFDEQPSPVRHQVASMVAQLVVRAM